jgi:hypothetical protein
MAVVGLRQAFNALPAAVEIVEAVIFLIDDNDVFDPVEPGSMGCVASGKGDRALSGPGLEGQGANPNPEGAPAKEGQRPSPLPERGARAGGGA